MDDWHLSTTDVPSFEVLFSRLRRPLPPDRTVTTKTKAPVDIDINISGSQLQGFRRLSIENLVLSSDHGLAWAIDLLQAYGPLPSIRYCQCWDPRLPVLPRQIRSEEDTATYLKIMLIEPAVAAAVFIRAQHLGLTAAQGSVYPEHNWELVNCSTSGRGSGRSDHAIVRSLPVRTSDLRFVALMEFKTWHVCQSNGEDLDGQRLPSIPVIENLQQWLEEEGGYIPMDPPNAPPRQAKQFNYYEDAWKKKLQKILFQVRSDSISSIVAANHQTVLARHRSAKRPSLFACKRARIHSVTTLPPSFPTIEMVLVPSLHPAGNSRNDDPCVLFPCPCPLRTVSLQRRRLPTSGSATANSRCLGYCLIVVVVVHAVCRHFQNT